MKNCLQTVFFLSSTLIILFTATCKKIVPDESIPMYVTVNHVKTLTNYNTQGTDSQKITAIQVFNGENNIGTYSLPTKIPWINSNQSLWQIYGAVNENGINATKVFYPFFQPDTTYISFNPNNPITIVPRMRYLPSTVFSLLEDFESGNAFVKYSGDTTLRRVQDKSQAYQGTAFGALYFNSTVKTCDIETQNTIQKVPLTGVPFYVELNYKCNMPFQIGIESIQGANAPVFDYPVTINPKTTWNKIYINLTYNVQQAQADYYILHITATKPDTLTNGYVFIDNVKVLHL